MKILITNDDGINAIGIKKLSSKLSKIGDITVIAPDTERSATGHAITMHHPLRVSKSNNFDSSIKAWSINGTPSDCIKIGVETIMSSPPDIIVSGINNGPNLGTDVIYSGTVSAAIEGAIHNIPSIAVSIYNNGEVLNYEGAAEYSCKIVETTIKNNIPKNLVLNVNVPSLYEKEIKGMKLSHLGIRKYTNSFEERKDPMGKSYYWLAGSLLEVKNHEDSDVETVKKGYISITPLHFDLTDYNYLKKMKNWNLNL